MTESSAERALTASAVALVLAVVCTLLFVPPLVERYLDEPARLVANALVLATALPLHWAFLGIALRRMGRPVPGWLALAVLLFPVGGAAALILLSWLSEEGPAAVPSR